MLLFDQDPAGALASGESRTRYVTLSTPATSLPLRITLTWTDPPGNPIAAVKLVNDLDLLVTNLYTGEIYWGNDIPTGSVANAAWNPASPPNPDRVNNVETAPTSPGGALFGHHCRTRREHEHRPATHSMKWSRIMRW